MHINRAYKLVGSKLGSISQIDPCSILQGHAGSIFVSYLGSIPNTDVGGTRLFFGMPGPSFRRWPCLNRLQLLSLSELSLVRYRHQFHVFPHFVNALGTTAAGWVYPTAFSRKDQVPYLSLLFLMFLGWMTHHHFCVQAMSKSSRLLTSQSKLHG